MNDRPSLTLADVVLFAIGAMLLVSVSSVIAWRMGYAPDEESHLIVVRVLAEEHRPLNWEDTRFGTERGHGYHLYSPVSYLPYVPAQWLADAVGPLNGATRPDDVVVRFGAWPIAVAQLAASWSLARRVLHTSPARTALAVAVAVNLLPQLRYMHAYVTTDGMTVLAGTVAVALALRVLQRPRVTVLDGALAGLTVVLCAHVRYNALIVAVLAVAVLTYRAVVSDEHWRTRFRPLAVSLTLVSLLAAPFHLWVYQELANRQLTASTSHEQLRESTFLGQFTPDVSTSQLIRTRLDEVDGIGQGFWLGFQKYHLISYGASRMLTLAVVIGIVAAVAARRIDRSTKVLTGALIIAFFTTWVAMAAQWPFTAHGRFLLPAGLSLVAVATAGPTVLLERTRVPELVVPGALALAFCWHLQEGIRALGA